MLLLWGPLRSLLEGKGRQDPRQARALLRLFWSLFADMIHGLEEGRRGSEMALSILIREDLK